MPPVLAKKSRYDFMFIGILSFNIETEHPVYKSFPKRNTTEGTFI